jgi:hypothetical protein
VYFQEKTWTLNSVQILLKTDIHITITLKQIPALNIKVKATNTSRYKHFTPHLEGTNHFQKRCTNLPKTSHFLPSFQSNILTINFTKRAVKIYTYTSPLLPYCRFQTLTLTLTNTAVPICTPTSPRLAYFSSTHSHYPHLYSCTNLHSHQPTVNVLSVPDTHTNLHQHRCTNLHSHQTIVSVL